MRSGRRGRLRARCMERPERAYCGYRDAHDRRPILGDSGRAACKNVFRRLPTSGVVSRCRAYPVHPEVVDLPAARSTNSRPIRGDNWGSLSTVTSLACWVTHTPKRPRSPVSLLTGRGEPAECGPAWRVPLCGSCMFCSCLEWTRHLVARGDRATRAASGPMCQVSAGIAWVAVKTATGRTRVVKAVWSQPVSSRLRHRRHRPAAVPHRDRRRNRQRRRQKMEKLFLTLA